MKQYSRITTSNPETVTVSRAEYEAQRERIAQLDQKVSVLMEALRLARHKRFSASSEKTDESVMEQLSFLFNEAEVYADKQKEAPVPPAADASKKHKKREYTLDTIPEGTPTEVVEHRLEGEALVCPECGSTMTEIGKEVVNKLKIKPAEVIVEQHIYYTYACRKCNETGIETPVVKAPREKSIIPGSFATPEAIAHIMTQKFVMGSPLYRQEQELNRQGIQLSRQTMSNWILRATEDYLQPVYRRLHEELLKREVLHADETTLQVLHEPGKAPQSDSFMWLYRTSGDTDKPIVLYEYQPGRGAAHPEAFLKGFHGYLYTDGLQSRLQLPAAQRRNRPPSSKILGDFVQISIYQRHIFRG
ncbi:MAG: IS66 family transposase [Eubacteriales bacterium]|nr:IS66 family transposase [Eubacteriales bacterium]